MTRDEADAIAIERLGKLYKFAEFGQAELWQTLSDREKDKKLAEAIVQVKEDMSRFPVRRFVKIMEEELDDLVQARVFFKGVMV